MGLVYENVHTIGKAIEVKCLSVEQIQCFLQLISYHADMKLDSSGYIESH